MCLVNYTCLSTNMPCQYVSKYSNLKHQHVSRISASYTYNNIILPISLWPFFMQYIVKGGGWIAPRVAVMPLPVIESETNLNPALWGLQLPKDSGQPIKAISNIDKSYPNSSPLGQNGCHSQAIILDVFSWMKLFVFVLKFWLTFHWSLFLRVQLTIP